jgi:site-specific DNA-methyltransferase (adenine-specific)
LTGFSDPVKKYEAINNMSLHNEDCILGIKRIPSDSVQVIIADPPYNIGKDFGNDSDKQVMSEYLKWSKEWITECFRVLSPDGTMYIYGFPEILAQIQVACIEDQTRVRWLAWHYTNKTVPSAKFWQRSHESILCVWKKGHRPHFNLDDVREPYTDTFLNNAAGKSRKASKGRFSKGEKETTYTANDKGAMPRDVIKVPALAGGAGKKERVDHPTQKPLEICTRLLKAARKPDCTVLVPFAGSGSECVAARDLGLNWTAFEINPVYVTLIQQRLRGPDPPETPQGVQEEEPSS